MAVSQRCSLDERQSLTSSESRALSYYYSGVVQNANGSYTIYEAGYQVWFSKQIYPACSNHFVEMATIGEWWCAESIDDRLALPRGAWQFRCPGARSRSNGYVTQACSLSKAVIPITQKKPMSFDTPIGPCLFVQQTHIKQKIIEKKFLVYSVVEHKRC